jgi:ribose transport system permease protein
MMATATMGKPLSERLEPYISIIGPMVMIVAILLFMALVEPARYFRASNINLILLDAALYMPMAMAMTFVITQRGIDLSIGSIAALCGIIMAFLIKQYGFSVYLAIPIALVLGALMGLINGLIITRFNVPDLIGTLAMDLVYRGFALVLAKGLVLARFPDLLTDIGDHRQHNDDNRVLHAQAYALRSLHYRHWLQSRGGGINRNQCQSAQGVCLCAKWCLCSAGGSHAHR